MLIECMKYCKIKLLMETFCIWCSSVCF